MNLQGLYDVVRNIANVLKPDEQIAERNRPESFLETGDVSCGTKYQEGLERYREIGG